MEEWRSRCPIVRFRRHLLDAAIGTDEQLKKIETRVEELIAAAAQYGLDSPWPSPEEAVEDVFA
jgi:pyruvate dehydrogenase E1 component alpha subunit